MVVTCPPLTPGSPLYSAIKFKLTICVSEDVYFKSPFYSECSVHMHYYEKQAELQLMLVSRSVVEGLIGKLLSQCSQRKCSFVHSVGFQILR